MLTAKDEVESEVEVLDAGADDYLTKPVNKKRLLARVGRFFIQRKKILIVDDSEDARQLLVHILGSKNYLVVVAENGKTALPLVSEEKPDLIITDYNMPEMDGMTFLRQLKSQESTRRIPIIMLTAKDEVESEVEVIDAGADDYLTKPVNAKRLVSRVKRILRD
jgi:DNA-binding response OmpR family regulator